MPTGLPKAAAPAGFISFCLRFPDQCTAPANAPSGIVETALVWQTLSRVNSAINGAIAPEDDRDHYGRAEYWTIPTDGLGDCDDYALAKRKALIDAGFPQNALRVAVVRTWYGERHTVLTVATDRGDYVLDNLRPDVLAWTGADYTWVERQAADNPWNWVDLESDGSATRIAAAEEPAVAPPTAKAGILGPRAGLEQTALLVEPQPLPAAALRSGL